MSTTKQARSEQGAFVIGAGNLDWYVDTTAELPVSGLTEGDTVYDRQTDTLYIATSTTTLEAVGSGSGLGLGATPVTQAFGDVAAGGSALTASKNDHRHGMPALGVSPVTQAFGDVPAGGGAVTAAKTDHRHGMPADPTPAFATPAIALGTAAAAGSAGTVIRSNSTIAAFDATAPVTQAFNDAGNPGTAVVAARRDHRHGMPATPLVPTLVRKSANEPVTSTTVLQNDDHLVYTMTANHTWAFKLVVSASHADGAVGLKSQFTGPASSTWSGLLYTHAGGIAAFSQATAPADTAGVPAAGRVCIYDGIVTCGATAGNFQYQWTQAANSGTPLIVATNSYLLMTLLV
jgi:hypothetical protein